MLKNLSQLEVQIGEKCYRLMCDMDSPLEHVKEALFQFIRYVGQVEDQVRVSQEQSKSEVIPEVNEETKTE